MLTERKTVYKINSLANFLHRNPSVRRGQGVKV